MFTTFRRLGVIGLLVGVSAILPAVSAQPSVPPYNRDEPRGEPPAVPGGDDSKAEKDEPEVLGRGPVHEGFAQPAQPARAGAVVPTAPPAPIEEQPPEEKPEGDNVVWVPGYWSWEAERRDFLWVSGFWRVAPAGRKWVPGYWAKTDDGHQWVGGFWAPANQRELPYVPDAPPDSLDRGPSIPAPADDYSYVPGNWAYQESRYVWQPGFWCKPRLGLVWCPPRWCWTPRGYLHVNGYWDACLEDRGILFAPVYFPRPIWRRPGYVFCPHYAVPTAGLLSSLWIGPGAGSYAYGDFYAGRYAKAGYQPWAVYGPRVRDPLYGYYRWANRDNVAWQRNLAGTYRDRVNGDAPLPPRTLAAQQRLATRTRNVPANLEVMRPINRFGSDNLRLARQTQQERAVQQKRVESFRQASELRRAADARSLPRNQQRVLPLPQTTPPVNRQSETPRLKTAPKLEGAPRVNPAPKLEAPRNNPTPRLNPAPNPTPRQGFVPKVEGTPRNKTAPKVEGTPRINPAPLEKVRPTPAPKLEGTPRINPAPKVDPAPRLKTAPKLEGTPRVNPAPLEKARPAPAPKLEAPRNNPTPRLNPAPNPVPRINPAPKVDPAPRLNPAPQIAPAPRINPAPNPAPRIAPAPRINPAPAPKINPAPAIRSAPPAPRFNPAPARPAPAPRAAPPPPRSGGNPQKRK